MYGDQTKLQTRNRFIVWRTSHDILDLFEASLDWNLSGSRVRYRFQDTPVLSGISVHETFHHIVILVATVSSVHKLVFPHPCRLHKQDFQVFQDSEEGIPSIFAEASNITPKEHYHVVPGMGVSKSEVVVIWFQFFLMDDGGGFFFQLLFRTLPHRGWTRTKRPFSP